MGSLPQPRLYFLDADLSEVPKHSGRILSCLPDGSDLKTVIDKLFFLPDGITVDNEKGHIYWTNMGSSLKESNGSIERANLDGTDRKVVVPAGSIGVFTPKQITLAPVSRKLYWCDREGMKVMRANLDGSDAEILVSTGSTAEDRLDLRNWCVGITVDEVNGFFYWSQKGPSKGNQGRIFRSKISAPAEIETVFQNLPEPIDLELEVESQTLYWTDRGDPPRGNSLNRAFVGAKPEADGRQVELLAKRLHESIGLAVDFKSQIAYVTDLSGGLYSVDIAKKEKKVLYAELGDLTGIALAH